MEPKPSSIPVVYEKNNILAHIRETVEKWPDRPAVISGEGDVRLAYRELDQRANRLANALARMGVGKGDRVALFQTNHWRYAEQYLALLKLGAICVPMNFRLRSPEALFILIEAGAKVVIFEDRYVPVFEPIREYLLPVSQYICAGLGGPEWAERYDEVIDRSSPEEPPPVELDLDSIAAISFTSGTTGLPKGSISTHGNVLVNLYDTMFVEYIKKWAVHPRLGYTINLINVPIYHIGGVLFLYTGMAQGVTLVIPQAFSPDGILEIIRREEVTTTYLVPTMFAMILDHPKFSKEKLQSLRYVSYGAMPMNPDLLRRILREFPSHIKFTDAFGMTECNAATVCKFPEDHDLTGTPEEVEKKLKHLAGVGRPLSVGIETRLADEEGRDVLPGVVGEFVCRGQKVTPGYWRNAERTREAFDADGWLHTGDMGWRDEDGYYYFADRSKDMINRGGENIYPMEIERVLVLHPKVREAAVFGTSDPRWGKVVQAAVVLNPGESLTEAELQEFCKKKLASYKCPSKIQFMPELPRSFEGGKVLRRVLRERYG